MIWGFDVLDKMEAVETTEKGRPLEDIVINSVTIHANPLAENI